ncbi:alpha/beta hydrolase [Candidatus Woesearchaeota archaeon]|nr:alpha/beta hydrolase [Candidatus Woesearchaeota archaeon]
MLKEGYAASEDGTGIYYRYLDKKRPWLVFLHGGTGCMAAFFNQERFFLKKGFSLVLIDLRGHGKSDKGKTKEFFEFRNFAMDVKAVLDKLGISKATIIGHCFGSLVAQEFVARYPKRVDRLVLINSGLAPFRNKAKQAVIWLFARLMTLVPVSGKKAHPDYSRQVGRHDISPAGVFCDLVYSGSKTFLYTYLASACFKSPIKGIVEKPVLLLHGKSDIIIPYSNSFELQKVFPNSEVKLLNTNHISVFNDPDEINRRILDFLRAT